MERYNVSHNSYGEEVIFYDDDGKHTNYSEAMEEIRKRDNLIIEQGMQIANFNPCGHTEFESISCGVCGYPDSRKLIADLKDELELSDSVRHAEEEILIKEIDLNAKLRAAMTCKFCGGKIALCEKCTPSFKTKTEAVAALINDNERAEKVANKYEDRVNRTYTLGRKDAITDYRAEIKKEGGI